MSVEEVGDHISRSSPGGNRRTPPASEVPHTPSTGALPLQLPRQRGQSTGGLTGSSLRAQSRDDDDVLSGSLIPVAAGKNHLTTVRRRAFAGCALHSVDTGPGSRQALRPRILRARTANGQELQLAANHLACSAK